MQLRIWLATIAVAACARESPETPAPARDPITLSAAPATGNTASAANTTPSAGSVAAAVDSARNSAGEDSAHRAWLEENDPPLPPPPKIEGYPIVYKDRCIGEACDTERIVRACADIPLHESASKDSPRTLVLKKGDTAIAGQDLHVIAPGIVVIKRDFARDHAISEEGNRVPLPDTIRFTTEDTVFLELYGQIGAWHARYKGKQLALDEFWGAPKKWNRLGGAGTDSTNAVLRSEHYIDTWWPIRLPDGRIGWKFRNQDADLPLMVYKYPHEPWDWHCKGS